jgi:3'-phosphoadenosine 5'-phosphosulfate sulfotransferase (PAPS reductase)/FAD synthetase
LVSADLFADTAEVVRLTRPQREARVARLIDESREILASSVQEHVINDGREVAGLVVLFSGGNDSTTLAHLFRDQATHAAHANTTVGIEKTRDFVRNVCEEWGLPLIERMPPREVDHYASLVRAHGFPGPGHHYKMFQRLKERALEQVRRELVSNPYRERVVFIAGRRRDESQRRANVPIAERRGSTVWVSPLVNWTKADLTTYRLMQGDVPANEVSDLIHMSGECLCGSFASPNEREEISYWFPDAFDQMAALELEIADRDDIPAHRKTWGWGADPVARAANKDGKPSKVGPLCSACDDRFQAPLWEESA